MDLVQGAEKVDAILIHFLSLVRSFQFLLTDCQQEMSCIIIVD